MNNYQPSREVIHIVNLVKSIRSDIVYSDNSTVVPSNWNRAFDLLDENFNLIHSVRLQEGRKEYQNIVDKIYQGYPRFRKGYSKINNIVGSGLFRFVSILIIVLFLMMSVTQFPDYSYFFIFFFLLIFIYLYSKYAETRLQYKITELIPELNSNLEELALFLEDYPLWKSIYDERELARRKRKDYNRK